MHTDDLWQMVALVKFQSFKYFCVFCTLPSTFLLNFCYEQMVNGMCTSKQILEDVSSIIYCQNCVKKSKVNHLYNLLTTDKVS